MAASRGPVNKKIRLQNGEEEGGKWGHCEKHKESLKLFCKEDETLVCLVCDKSKQHRYHEVIPAEEASKEYKGEINSRLVILRNERETIQAYQAKLEEESKDLIKTTETEKEKTVKNFKQLLNEIGETEKEIARRRDEQLARLSRELSSLERIIREMEKKNQQPSSELLQDVKITFQRCDRRERLNPLAFPPELKGKTIRLCDMNLRLEDVMKEFKDAMIFRLHLQKANVTLDPDTVHPCLILSEDRKSVRKGDQRQALPDNPERFNKWHCVLGREGFTAGRHFWEVTVGSEGEWAVGVAKKSVRRKGPFPFSPEGRIWALEKLENGYWTWNPPHPPLPLSWQPKKIQVILDYEGEKVAFYDADSGEELHTFSGASFSGETLLPFFRLWGNETHLKIS